MKSLAKTASTEKLQEKLADVYKVAHIGNWELDAKTLKTHWSDEICDIFGIPRGSGGGLSLLKTLLSNKDYKKVHDSLHACLKTGKEHHVVYRVHRPKDGDIRWVECRAKREVDKQNGEPIAIYGTLQDISKNIYIERRMENIRALLVAIRSVNQLILRIQDRNRLLEKICKEITSLPSIAAVWIILARQGGIYEWHSHGFEAQSKEAMRKEVEAGNLPACYEQNAQTLISYDKDPEKCKNCVINRKPGTDINFSVELWYEGKHYGRMGVSTFFEEEKDPYIEEMFIGLAKDIALNLRRLDFIENANALEKLHTQMFDSALNGIYVHDLEGNLIDVNPAIERLFDSSKEKILQANIRDFHLKGYEEKLEKNLELLLQDGYVHVKMPLQTLGGKEFYAELFSTLLEIDGKKLVQGTLHDITSSYEADKKMRQHKAISLSTKEGICITDDFAKIEYVNESFTAITGYTLEEVRGFNPSVLKSGRHDKSFYKNMWQSLEKDALWEGEIWNRKKNGRIYPEYLTIRKIEDTLGRVENYIAVFSDLSAKKLDQRKIDFLSTHDPLTQLPSRQNVKEKLDHLIENTDLEKHNILLACLDVDNFKHINESLGHSMGDKILVAIVKRLQSAISNRTTIGRLSADEFVLFRRVDAFDEGVQKIQMLLEEFKQPFEIDGNHLTVTVSIGASIAPDDASDAETLIKNADAAMNKVKMEGKSSYTFFQNEMTRRSYERILMENALRVSIEQEDFMLYYQPLQDLDSGDIVGFEGLIRWRHEELGIVSPDQFIPLAEETKLILPLGKWVIKEACRQLSVWKTSSAKKDYTIAINISSVQLYHSDIVAILQEYINHFQVDAKLLKLEITESTIMNVSKDIASTLEQIKKMGIALSIDDFGIGYSSLSRLKKLPVDILKVDRSFTMDIPEDKDACVLSKSILSIAKQMGLGVIVEGVETKEQKSFYEKEKGCVLQGYYLAKPMPIRELEEWLEK